MLPERWESEVVMRYVRGGKYLQRTSALNVLPSSSEIPAIADTTASAGCVVATPCNDLTLEALRLNTDEFRVLQEHATVAGCEAKDLDLLVSDLTLCVDALQRDNAPGYVATDGGSGPIHVVANSYRSCHPDLWVT